MAAGNAVSGKAHARTTQINQRNAVLAVLLIYDTTHVNLVADNARPQVQHFSAASHIACGGEVPDASEDHYSSVEASGTFSK